MICRWRRTNLKPRGLPSLQLQLTSTANSGHYDDQPQSPSLPITRSEKLTICRGKGDSAKRCWHHLFISNHHHLGKRVLFVTFGLQLTGKRNKHRQWLSSLGWYPRLRARMDSKLVSSINHAHRHLTNAPYSVCPRFCSTSLREILRFVRGAWLSFYNNCITLLPRAEEQILSWQTWSFAWYQVLCTTSATPFWVPYSMERATGVLFGLCKCMRDLSALFDKRVQTSVRLKPAVIHGLT